MYVLQYQEGYEIVSADKRSPVPIAYNEKGKLELNENLEGFTGHLDMMAEQIWYSLNGYGDNPDPEWEDEINGSLDFWLMVNADSSFIEQNGGRYIDPNLPPGHWVFLESDSFEQVYDTIPHLTVTQWHQFSNYGYYCPKYSHDYPTKCLPGCNSIAGAQMLYFLHGKDGVPTSSPSEGSCTGYVIDSSYVQTFSNPTSNEWSLMSVPRSSSDLHAARLIGDIGKRLHTIYQLGGSDATFDHLGDSVFVYYGWNSNLSTSYDASIIVSSLLSGYPVVCGAIDESDIGHAFLIDSYKRCRIKTITYYEWVFDDPEAGINNPVPLRREVTYSSPYVTHYRMNWGQYDTEPNDTWCSLAGVWQYNNEAPYVYEQKMFYNFTLL